MKQVELRIGGMSCGHCVRTVAEVLESLEGVRKADVDLTGGRAVVEYEEAKTTPRALVAAVKDEGYTAEETA